MKVLMLGKPGLLEKTGGDRVQIEQTAKNLEQLGVEVVIDTNISDSTSGFDLVHVFQLDWNPHCYLQIKKAKDLGFPVVFSTIHHKIEELKRFDDEFVFDFRRVSKFLFQDQFNRDLFKELYKSFFHPSELGIVLYSFTTGLKNMYTKALNLADVILVQTNLEAEDLKNTFGVDFKWEIVKNGVSKVFLELNKFNKSPLAFENYLICVGRIEPRKNQTSIIKAVKKLREELNLDLKLVVIGVKSKNKHFEYLKIFDELLSNNDWITYIPKVPYDEIAGYYKYAKVGISASWFETTGLTSLEAIFCGANAVASGERAKEYLGDTAFYCDPGDIDTIKNAVKNAYNAPRPVLTDQMKTEYTWENTAKRTLEIYNSLLAKTK